MAYAADRFDADAVAHYEMASDSLLAQAPALAKQEWYADDNKKG